LEEVEGRLYRPCSVVQSEVEAVFLDGVADDAAGLLELEPESDFPESADFPESLDFPASPDLLSDDDDGESVVVVVVDFDFPLRLSVL
jgi:hypothetical protein